jgi:hypothetical protein
MAFRPAESLTYKLIARRKATARVVLRANGQVAGRTATATATTASGCDRAIQIPNAFHARVAVVHVSCTVTTCVRLSPAIFSKSHPLHPSFTEFSTRFSPLYLISLQQRSLNLILYTLNPILETYFVPNFCKYVFIIPQTLWTYFIFI